MLLLIYISFSDSSTNHTSVSVDASFVSVDSCFNGAPDSTTTSNSSLIQENAVIVNGESEESLPSQIRYNNQIKFYFLNELYNSNKEFMDEKFKEMLPEESTYFYDASFLQVFPFLLFRFSKTLLNIFQFHVILLYLYSSKINI